MHKECFALHYLSFLPERAIPAAAVPEIGQDKVTGLTAALAAKADTSSLAAIATSGNMQDLGQTAGDLMILNCGSSSVNV